MTKENEAKQDTKTTGELSEDELDSVSGGMTPTIMPDGVMTAAEITNFRLSPSSHDSERGIYAEDLFGDFRK